MDQQRGRSPSAGRQPSHINHSHSPSPQHYQENVNTADLGLGLDTSLNQPYPSSNYPTSHGLPAYNQGFLNSHQGQQFNQSNISDGNFVQNPDYNQQSDYGEQFKQEDLQQNQASISPFSQQQQTSFTQQLLNNNNYNEGDFSLYSTPSGQGDQFDATFFLNEQSQQPSSQSINPADIMSDMSPPAAHTPTPPHMLQSDGQQPSSAHHSPVFNQHQFQRSPGHSRNASLAPESAAFPQGQGHTEWGMMPSQFTTHRRSPSEYSDVSASSAAPSPNLVQHDTFDPAEQHHSPFIRPQDPSGYQEVLGISNFSLSDPQGQRGASPRRGLSPAHSPAISPRLGPQQVPIIPQQNAFVPNMGMPNNVFVPSSGPETYAGQSQEAFGHASRNGSAEMGQAQQMVPPEINVEFAPASRQNSFEPPKPLSFDQDALTPPERGKFYQTALKS
jgi:transcription factor CRZ1